MRRWAAAIFATLIACVPILLQHASNPSLLHDSDTSVLLKAVRQRNAPFSWFTGDWPLQNHFYRPLPTLAFEWDNHFFGNSPAGYGWTNDILCVLCVLLLLWFVRELTDMPGFAGASAVLFASWHWGQSHLLTGILINLAMWSLLLVGVWRHRSQVKLYLPLFLAFGLFERELYGKADLSHLMINWLPARTASVMTVFALIAMASYARYERLRGHPAPAPKLTPLTPPATRNTVLGQDKQTSRFPAVWIAVSAVAVVLALASYEQAVMAPAALTGVAICMALRGYRPRWGWQALYWGLLGCYLLIRVRIVPSAPSTYQLQQYRHGPGVFLSISDFMLPVSGMVPSLWNSWDPSSGVMMLLNPVAFAFGTQLLETVSGLWVLRQRWVLAFAGWALSAGTFMPMAWLKQFDHYQYWPMALRSIFVVAFAWALWDAAVIAARPRVLQAPKRPAPAPGSLVHQ